MFGAVDGGWGRTVLSRRSGAKADGVATFWSADGLVRVFAGWCQKNHAPPRHSRHNKIQMNGRERITIGQMIISQNHGQSEEAYRRSEMAGCGRAALLSEP